MISKKPYLTLDFFSQHISNCFIKTIKKFKSIECKHLEESQSKHSLGFYILIWIRSLRSTFLLDSTSNAPCKPARHSSACLDIR